MARLRRLLGAQDGWGGAAGTLLLLVGGLVMLALALANLNEAARLKPVERACSDFLADPSGPRWVRLIDCEVDYTETPLWRDERLLPFGPGAYVRLPSLARTSVLRPPLQGMVTHEAGRVVVQAHARPERAKTLLQLVLGLVAIALTVRTVFMRWLVERDSTL